MPTPIETESAAASPARRWKRYVVGGVLALVAAYAGLFLASRAMQSPEERLARFDGDRLHVEGYGAAGEGQASGAVDRRYLEALHLLQDARTTTLGLFPRYDEAQLAQAEQTLEAVVQQAEAGSFVQLEALFFLGKAHLARGDRAAATGALRQVVAGEGRLAGEAQAILTELYEDAAYDGPPAGD